MRPAFITYLPLLGPSFAEHDRLDHERARTTLLQLYADFESLPLTDVEGVKRLTARFGKLMRELKEHMVEESGREIPLLEAKLSREESGELGRRYRETMVLGPELVVGGRRVWKGGVGEYVGTSREGFGRVWGEWLRERGRARL